MFLPQEILRNKRDSVPLTRAEFSHFTGGVVAGALSEGRIAAFAMATLLQGMSIDEYVSLALFCRIHIGEAAPPATPNVLETME